MKFVDAHSHLSFFSQEQCQSLLTASLVADRIGLGGYDADDWTRQLDLLKQYPQKLVTSFGLHPWRVIELSEKECQQQLQILQKQLPQAHACGELGLDWYKGDQYKQKQIGFFEQQLEINKVLNKPLVLHVVHAHEQALKILQGYSYAGFVHGFSSDACTAKRYIDLGYKISIGPGVYKKGYKDIKNCVQQLDLEHFVFESDTDSADTDANDVMKTVFEAVAELKSISIDEVMVASVYNFASIFPEHSSRATV